MDADKRFFQQDWVPPPQGSTKFNTDAMRNRVNKMALSVTFVKTRLGVLSRTMEGLLEILQFY